MTSPVSGSVFITAEECVELLISEVVDMMCDAHLDARSSWFYWGRFGRPERRIAREIFADDDVSFHVMGFSHRIILGGIPSLDLIEDLAYCFDA